MTDEDIKQARENAETGTYHGAEEDVLAALDALERERRHYRDEVAAMDLVERRHSDLVESLEQERDQLKAEVERLRYVIDSNAIDQGLDWKNDLFMTCYSTSKDRDHQRKRAEAWKAAAKMSRVFVNGKSVRAAYETARQLDKEADCE